MQAKSRKSKDIKLPSKRLKPSREEKNHELHKLLLDVSQKVSLINGVSLNCFLYFDICNNFTLTAAINQFLDC